tara:strand:- start:59 stop:1033 length:975 start_codon:yes stop_codon:yes gene_type:complete
MMSEQNTTKPKITLLLAAPRGFCAGVDRAIQIVERSLEKYGAPVYVRHEIVHNKFVVDSLRDKGAVFIEELDEIPANHSDRPVIFSAHGVPKSVPDAAEKLNLFYIDATCPLVSKVHREAERHHRNDAHLLLIGHKGHPEVIGTMGQLPQGTVSLIETKDDALQFTPPHPKQKLAFVTQTTLSVDDTAEIVNILRSRFPEIEAPKKEDICYATTNRQSAVKKIAKKCDYMLVIGAPNSSNSNRLVEVAKSYGANDAELIQNASDLHLEKFKNISILGLTAGASAPEKLVKDVIAQLQSHFDLSVEEVVTSQEDVVFKLPKAVAC